MASKKARVLIVSSDSQLFASSALSIDAHFDVEWAKNEAMAHFLMKEWSPQLIIMDARTGMDQLIRQVRQSKNSDVGIMVVAQSPNLDKETLAFQSGADQFVVAPFQTKTLQARINSLLRRGQGIHGKPVDLPEGQADNLQQHQAAIHSVNNLQNIRVGDLEIFPDEHMVKRDGQILGLSPIQVKLLHALCVNSDRLLTRAFLRQTVWEDSDISPRSIDAQISKLKKAVPEVDSHLLNIYGKGYVFSTSEQIAA